MRAVAADSIELVMLGYTLDEIGAMRPYFASYPDTVTALREFDKAYGIDLRARDRAAGLKAAERREGEKEQKKELRNETGD